MGPVLALPVLIGIASAVGVSAVGGTVIANVVKTTNARSDAIREEKMKFSWCTDEDDRERCCRVRCYKRRICGLQYHWALTFDWGDYKVTYEADIDKGHLIPRWNKGDPDIVSQSKELYEWEVSVSFPVTCSPQSVNAKALAIPYNGATYVLTKVNGHLWTECLARAFGIIHYKLSANAEMFIPAPVASTLDYFL